MIQLDGFEGPLGGEIGCSRHCDGLNFFPEIDTLVFNWNT